jgi:hypothetical protein
VEHDPFDPDLPAKERAHQTAVLEQRRSAVEQELLDLRWLMTSARGRRIVWQRIGASGLFHVGYDPQLDTSARQMAFAAGRRNEGLKLFDLVRQACPDEFLVMFEEHRKTDASTEDTDSDTAS